MDTRFKKGEHNSPETEIKEGQHLSYNTEIKKGQFSGKKNFFYGKKFVGKENKSWKGDSVGNEGLHSWVHFHYGKANKCENPDCVYPRLNARGKMMKEPKRYEWANISSTYKRDRLDFMMLCPSCHRKFDYEKKNN